MTHIMVDLETLGNTPYSVVPAIGAVIFTKDEFVDSFYQKIDVKQQLDLGLTVDASTLEWWMSQNDKAREAPNNQQFEDLPRPWVYVKSFEFCLEDHQ